MNRLKLLVLFLGSLTSFSLLANVVDYSKIIKITSIKKVDGHNEGGTNGKW